MCDICVMSAVKERMLSRRDVFTAGAAASAAAIGAATVARPALAAGHGQVVDMTHRVSDAFPTWGGVPGISMERIASFDPDGYNNFILTLNEHTGTHIDAPLHFTADGTSVDEIAVDDLVCPLAVIDIAARAAEDPDTMVTPDDIAGWVSDHGPIPDGACVAMHSGWADKTDGPGFRNADSDGVQHYPGFHPEASEMLLETGAAALAVDTLSIDHGASPDFATHYSWLPAGRYGIECLAGLDRMPRSGATIVVGAPKIAGGTGGPARIFGLI